VDVIVDDHLLLQILLDEEPPDLRLPGARLFVTGLWYHRLCRAVSNPSVAGVMTRSLGRAVPGVAKAALRSVTDLPETIGLLSLRELAWPMARLRDEGVRLNRMSLEALTAAEHLGAELCLAAADENPPLIQASVARGIPTRLVPERA
jgi:hypothetical protein